MSSRILPRQDWPAVARACLGTGVEFRFHWMSLVTTHEPCFIHEHQQGFGKSNFTQRMKSGISKTMLSR